MRLYELFMLTWKRYLDSGLPELGPTGAIEHVLMQLGLGNAEVRDVMFHGGASDEMPHLYDPVTLAGLGPKDFGLSDPPYDQAVPARLIVLSQEEK